VEQGPGEGGKGSGFGVQGRHRRGGKRARQGRWGEQGAEGERNSQNSHTDGHGRTRTNTDARGGGNGFS
jgi:hypothetical protein